eukprot:712780-Pelagomonas_calceolata.AAC.1
MRPGAQLEASQQQHSVLCKQLEGAEITLHTLQIYSGSRGDRFTSFFGSLTQLPYPAMLISSPADAHPEPHRMYSVYKGGPPAAKGTGARIGAPVSMGICRCMYPMFSLSVLTGASGARAILPEQLFCGKSHFCRISMAQFNSTTIK